MSEFNTFWKNLHILSTLQGSYVTISDDQKLTKFQQIYQFTWVVCMLNMIFLITSTIIMNRSDLSMVFQCLIMLQMFITGIAMFLNLMLHRKRLRKTLQWAKEKQAMDNVHMSQAVIFSRKIIKYLVYYFGLSWFSVTVGMIIIGQILPENIYPKFRPPQPFELPVRDRDNWTIYSITCIIQVLSVFYSQLQACSYYTFFATFAITFYEYLNTILDDITNFKELSEIWARKTNYNAKQDDSMFKLKLNEITEKYCQGLK